MKKEWINICLCCLILLFVGSIFWVNFHSAFWYDMDMALNSHEAKLMWEQKSLFPEGWIFGNQYQIVDTVNLAALCYGLVHQSTLAMSLASCLGMLLILGAFAWCVSPYVSRQGLMVGMLCLVGGTIFGTSAASYTKGLQVLYTMASYYASYLFVLLLTIGVWLRIKEGKKIHWAICVVLLLLNFGIGMNSLREALILGTPLLISAGVIALVDKNHRQHFVFATSVFLAEMSGYLLMKSLHVPAVHNVMDVYPDFRPISVFYNWTYASKDLLRVSGIALYRDGFAYIPLSLCALAVATGILWGIFHIFKTKDFRPLTVLMLLSVASILCVYGAGVFMIRTRAIYYFVYWLLAALSVIYLIETTRIKGLIPVIFTIALVNFGYQFFPDFRDWHRYGDEMKAVTKSLVAEGYTTLYHDDCAVFAAASKDQIEAAPIRIDNDAQQGFKAHVFPYNKDTSLYDESHQSRGVICISDFSLPSIEGSIPSPSILPESRMVFIQAFRWGKRHIQLYRPDELILSQ